MLLGLLLVPIHRDTLTNLKTEIGGVVKGHNKKSKAKIRTKWVLSSKETGTAKKQVAVPVSNDLCIIEAKTEHGEVVKERKSKIKKKKNPSLVHNSSQNHLSGVIASSH